MLGYLLIIAFLFCGQLLNPQLTVPKGAQEAAKQYFENKWKPRGAENPGYHGDKANFNVQRVTLDEGYISHEGTREDLDAYARSPIADPRYFTTDAVYIFPIVESQQLVSSLMFIENKDDEGQKLDERFGEFTLMALGGKPITDVVELRKRFPAEDGFTISKFYFDGAWIKGVLLTDPDGKLFVVSRSGAPMPIEKAAADWKSVYLSRESQNSKRR
jgi:hypothetical protein